MSNVHGKRLLPTTIDHIAQTDPNRIWAASQKSGSKVFEDIPFSTFANAINRCARWIVETLGEPPAESKKRPVVAYIGASDLRYYVFAMAIGKAGYTPLFTSHLNSEAANSALFEATACKTLLYGFDDLGAVKVNKQNLKIFKVPGPGEIWDTKAVNPFPFAATFEEAFSRPLLILHTSGSSGMPKPITYTHGSFATTDLPQDVPDYEGHISAVRLRKGTGRFFIGLPPFHGAGVLTGLQDSVFMNCVIVFPAADRPLDAQCLIDAIDHADIRGAGLLPHTMESVAKSPEALARLHKLQCVAWVGGPISQAAGDLISGQTTLLNSYASTELGAAHTLVKKDSTLWPYYFFDPRENGFDFRPVQGQPGLYEMFAVKDSALSQHVFRIFPHLDEWPMKDLFTPHPTLAHHWRLEGRADDLIVFKNGSKLNPRSIEDAIKAAFPGVIADALVFGAGRVRPGVLIEPVEPRSYLAAAEDKQKAETAFLDSVFEVLDKESDGNVSRSAGFVRELLAVTSPQKPLPRSGKRTVQRGIALQLYGEEIDKIYAELPANLQHVKDYRIGAE